VNPWLEPLTRRRRYTVAPRTWVPGELVTAGMMNTLRDQLLQIEAGTAAISGTTASVFTGTTAGSSFDIRTQSTDKLLQIRGGPEAVGGGACINIYGNTSPYSHGGLSLYNGTGAGNIDFYLAGYAAGPALSINNAGIISARAIKTLSGISAVSPSGVAVTLFALPGIQSYESSLYLVQAGLPSNDAPNYGAYALIIQLGGSARILHQINAPLMQISLSGLTVLGAQSCGAAASVYWSFLRIPA